MGAVEVTLVPAPAPPDATDSATAGIIGGVVGGVGGFIFFIAVAYFVRGKMKKVSGGSLPCLSYSTDLCGVPLLWTPAEICARIRCLCGACRTHALACACTGGYLSGLT